MRQLITAIIIALCFSLLFSCSEPRKKVMVQKAVRFNGTYTAIDSSLSIDHVDTMYKIGDVFYSYGDYWIIKKD